MDFELNKRGKLVQRFSQSRLCLTSRNMTGPELLVNWIIDYFSQGEGTSRHVNINQALLGASPIIVTDKPPIVLQHSGHSRTVIGFERKKDGSINLLMFDPSRYSSNLHTSILAQRPDIDLLLDEFLIRFVNLPSLNSHHSYRLTGISDRTVP